MKGKIQIHQFDPVVYPFKIWVTTTDNIDVLKERFLDFKGKELEGDLKDCLACTMDVVSKENKDNHGSVIVFTHKKYITPKHMAHEAYHATSSLWEYIGERNPSEEATAYLVGFITDCCYKVKINKFE